MKHDVLMNTNSYRNRRIEILTYIQIEIVFQLCLKVVTAAAEIVPDNYCVVIQNVLSTREPNMTSKQNV